METEVIKEYDPNKNNDVLLQEIYKKRNDQVLNLLDKNDYFLLYEINNLKKVLPSLQNEDFIKMVKNDLFEKNRFTINKDLMLKIQKKQFTDADFLKLSKGIVNNLNIDSISDTKKFTQDSVTLLYSLGMNNFSLVSDTKNNVYLAKIKNINENNLNKNSQESESFAKQTNKKIQDRLYNSYDFLLNEKYKITINEKALDRMKNYFR